jgi:putative spermidine/putrescine transport system substrate-binding protein
MKTGSTMTQRTELSRSTALALTRRQLLQRTGLAAGAVALGGLGFPRLSRAAGEINFWAPATLDIEGGWKTFTKESGVGVAFTDNGNDPGPVVAKLAAGNANDVYDVGGLNGGSEKELAKQGLIAPWDINKIPNYASVWQWVKDLRHSCGHQR